MQSCGVPSSLCCESIRASQKEREGESGPAHSFQNCYFTSADSLQSSPNCCMIYRNSPTPGCHPNIPSFLRTYHSQRTQSKMTTCISDCHHDPWPRRADVWHHCCLYKAAAASASGSTSRPRRSHSCFSSSPTSSENLKSKTYEAIH